MGGAQGNHRDWEAPADPTAERSSGEYLHDGTAGGDSAQILAAAPDAIVEMDGLGNILAVNPAFARLVGVSAEDVRGRPMLSWVASEDRAALETAFGRVHRGEGPALAEVGLTRDGGTRRVAFNLGCTEPDADGGFGVVGVGRDITYERSMEERFARADKLATVGRLAAGVVHEINNPLTAICAYADHLALSLASGDPQDLARVERILEAAERIRVLVRRLLAYTPSPTEVPSEVHLGEVVIQAVGYCEHLARVSGVDVRRQIEPSAPRVLGLRGELTQVVVNLLTNACHACIAPGGRIDVVVEAMASDRARMIVRDNGHGIASEHLPRIFEPFYSTRSNDGAGTGLGLVIVRSILERHGAALKIESVVGEGTAFVMEFPACPREGER